MATKHVIQNKNFEVAIAIVLVAAGCFLIWDSFDNRGRELPWFARWFSFW